MSTARKVWTLEELHSLPEDGNTYELVRGELFVTPAPTFGHELIVARLTRLLDPFVAAHQLGFVFHPHAVIRFEGSEVEPDIMVLPDHPYPAGGWDLAPTARLVVEVISPSTGRRDREQKRSLYMDAGVPEYWIVDGERRTITVVKPGEADRVERERVSWTPAGAGARLVIELSEILGA